MGKIESPSCKWSIHARQLKLGYDAISTAALLHIQCQEGDVRVRWYRFGVVGETGVIVGLFEEVMGVLAPESHAS